MVMLVIIGSLFILTGLSPWVFPNRLISNDEYDLKD